MALTLGLLLASCSTSSRSPTNISAVTDLRQASLCHRLTALPEPLQRPVSLPSTAQLPQGAPQRPADGRKLTVYETELEAFGAALIRSVADLLGEDRADKELLLMWNDWHESRVQYCKEIGDR